MDNELHGAAAHSHQYYTVEGGEYDNNRRAEGVIYFIIACSAARALGTLVGLAEVWIKRKRQK